jgi:hypothetical protein
MGGMAFRTIAALHGGMNKRAIEFFFESIVALQTELSRGPRFQLILVRLRKNQRETQEKNAWYNQQENLQSKFHGAPLHEYKAFTTLCRVHRGRPKRICLGKDTLSSLFDNVALLTGSPYERRMIRRLEKLRIHGGMGIVAVSAIDHRGVYFQMSFGERCLFEVVALSTEGLDLLVQQRRLL